MKCVFLIGRALFSSVFLMKAFYLFSGAGLAYALKIGVPMPTFMVPLAGILALLGGLSLLLGYKARVGAWILVIFLVPITLIMHRFWEVSDGHIVMFQHFCFMKNISLLGAVLMIAYAGSGPFSLTPSPFPKK